MNEKAWRSLNSVNNGTAVYLPLDTEGLRQQYQSTVENFLQISEQLSKRLELVEGKEKRWREFEAVMKDNASKAKTKVCRTSVCAEIQITLNIGGKKFATAKATLLNAKGSYFEAMLSSGHWKPDEDGEYFIDRDAKHFMTILNYLRFVSDIGERSYTNRTGKIDLTNWKKGDLEKLQEDLDYYQIQLPEAIARSHQVDWAVAGAPNYKLSGWQVVTIGFLTENWESFCKASEEGIKVLNSFTQTNPLPHVEDSSRRLAYVHVKETSTGYLSVKGERNGDVNEGDKVYFAPYQENRALDPHAAPVKTVPRTIDDGYLVILHSK